MADTFCGSGQILFEAARLGCDVYASDLNPVACMLTWGSFHIVGGSFEEREKFERDRKTIVGKVKTEIDRLGIETDGCGWRAKVFLYCVEVRCPQTGWRVPLLPSRVVSKTETDSALRDGSNVKGTVLLVCRKRRGDDKITRDDLAWEIQDEVEAQVRALTGLNQEARGPDRDENVFEDADLQMAGYAAALRTLTRYARIDGRDMTSEAIRPRVRNETTFVDDLIAFAVDAANQCLVPQGIASSLWEKLSGAERFYLKMLDLEARGAKSLDNYQNFAKAFKVRDFYALMGDRRANRARLKGAAEFGRAEMGEGSELHGSVLRAVLYAVMELRADVDTTEVLAHLTHNVPDYYGDLTQRERAVAVADYLAEKLETLRPEEASAARVLAEAVRNQRLG